MAHGKQWSAKSTTAENILGAGETAFVGAGVIPAPRSYKSSL